MKDKRLLSQSLKRLRSLVFGNISRKHFKIKKNGEKITITDHSYWGTYINKLTGENSNTRNIGAGKSVQLEHDDIISIHKPGHKCFQFKLLSAEEIESKKKTKAESAERSQRATPGKHTSPAGVNDSNLVDGKRKRRPKANDPDFIWN